MRYFVKLVSVVLALTMLSSCSVKLSKENQDPPVVTIETYQSESTTTSESTNTPPTTATELTTTTVPTEETTVPSSEVTSESTTDTSETTVTTTSETTTEATTTTTATTTEQTTTAEEYIIETASEIKYTTDNLNIRKEPDADSQRVGRYKKGEEVIVTGYVSNGWVRVSYDGGEYFVNGKYLTEKTEEVTTSQTAVTEATTTEYVGEEEIIEEELENVIIGSNNYNALNYLNQKAIWFAYLDINVMLKNASDSDFRSSVAKAYDDVVALGFNTVYVHVRAFGDAYYFSDYYSFTDAYSGKMGDRPSYDPLRIMIDEAHSRGLSFHAWVNPMRTTDKARFKQMDDDYTLKKWYDSSSANGTYLVFNSKTDFYWLSPAYPAVRELICNGIAELVTNYNVDAIHIDDYFYPTTSTQFDEAAYKASGTNKTLSDWRRSVVSILVREMYQTVKNCNSSVLFGISPAGNTKNNYESYYADIYTWGSSVGYCDYMVPQIYYGYEDKLPFDDTVTEWKNIITNPNVKLICGIAAYKVGSNSEWSSGNMVKRQIDLINSNSSYTGYALYRYDMIFNPADDVKNLMYNELYNILN